MQYKTIILELLEQQPQTYERLRQERAVLKTVDLKALELKQRHEAWIKVLTPAQPDSSPNQLSAAALELAMRDLEECMAIEPELADLPAPTLEAAIEFVRRHSSLG